MERFRCSVISFKYFFGDSNSDNNFKQTHAEETWEKQQDGSQCDENTNKFSNFCSDIAQYLSCQLEEVTRLPRLYVRNAVDKTLNLRSGYTDNCNKAAFTDLNDGVLSNEMERLEIHREMLDQELLDAVTSSDECNLGDTEETQVTASSPTIATEHIPFVEVDDNVPKLKNHTISDSVRELVERKLEAEEDQYDCLDKISDNMSYLKRVMKKEDSVQSFYSVSSSRSSTLNIIPDMEQVGAKSPHLRKRMNTRRKASIIEKDYMKLKQQLITPDKCPTDYGNIHLSIQYLLVTQRLKVTIHSVTGVAKDRSLSHAYTKTFVKACLMPRTDEKQLRTKKVKETETVHFDTELYFNNIEFESVHLLAVRFQVFLATNKLFGSRKCIAETIVWLDGVNVVDNDELIANLSPSE